MPYPVCSLELKIEGSCSVSSNTGCQSINDNKGSEKGPSVVWIEDPNNCKEEDENCTIEGDAFVTC
jgi:hypothetical protein